MYKDYIKERENKEILETEDGFAVYGYNCIPGLGIPHCYIQDIYCIPERRHSGTARKMADKISQEAKDRGFKVVFGSVDSSAQGAHRSLLVLVAYGMQLHSINGTVAWFSKEI